MVATQLQEILPYYTKMPVDLITEHLLIRPNRVFIIPSRHDLHVLDGGFRLKPISKPRGWPDVITVFLRSLTEHFHGKIIAVIVSCYDGDGAEALCGIRDIGGVTIAQRPDTAGQADMVRRPEFSPPEAGRNRHLRPVNSPPLAGGSEPLSEAGVPLTTLLYIALQGSIN